MTVNELIKRLQAHLHMNRSGKQDQITIAHDGSYAQLQIEISDKFDPIVILDTDAPSNPS